MLDMLLRCGGREKTDFVFFNTGLEYRATLEHLDELEEKYGIKILREKPEKPIPAAVKEFGIPFWSKEFSQFLEALQLKGFLFKTGRFQSLFKNFQSLTRRGGASPTEKGRLWKRQSTPSDTSRI